MTDEREVYAVSPDTEVAGWMKQLREAVRAAREADQSIAEAVAKLKGWIGASGGVSCPHGVVKWREDIPDGARVLTFGSPDEDSLVTFKSGGNPFDLHSALGVLEGMNADLTLLPRIEVVDRHGINTSLVIVTAYADGPVPVIELTWRDQLDDDTADPA